MAITSTSTSTSATTTSSLDVASIVSQLMTAENKPIESIKAKITGQQLVISELGVIKSKVAALQDALGVFEDINTYGNMTASTDNAAVVNATAGSTASPGTYSVQVAQAAQKGTYNIMGFSSATDAIVLDTTDGFQITVGTGASAITYKSNGDKIANGITTPNSVSALASNPTVTTLKDWINSVSGKTNVTASISQASVGNYALIVSGSLEGASNDFVLSGLVSGTNVINFTSPDAKVLLDATNGFQMTIGGVTYKSAGTGANVQAIVGTGSGGIVTVNDLASWINSRSSANQLGISATVTGSGASYQLVITQNASTQGVLRLAGIQPYEAISGYENSDGSDLISIDAVNGFSVTVGNTVYNTKGTKTVGTNTPTNISILAANSTVTNLKDWINSVASGDAIASYEGSGTKWSLYIKSVDTSKAISATGLNSSLTSLNISDAGFSSTSTLLNIDTSTGFVLTIGGHTYSTLGLKDGTADAMVGTLSSSATLTNLKDWINALNVGVTASTPSSNGSYSLSLVQAGTPASDLAVSGLKPNAVANGFTTATDVLSSSLSRNVSSQTATDYGDRTITISDSDVSVGTAFRLEVNGEVYTYTAQAGDDGASVATGLKTALLTDYADGKVLSNYPLEVSRTQGAGNDEIATFAFSEMKAGDRLTIAGLTITAKRDLNANEVASAFNGLQDGWAAPTETTIISGRSSDPFDGRALIQIQDVVAPTTTGLYKLTNNGSTLTMTRYVNGASTGSSSIVLITSGTSDPNASPPTVLFNPNSNDLTTLNFGSGYGSFTLKVTTQATSSETAGDIVEKILSATQGEPSSIAGTWAKVSGAAWADIARTNLNITDQSTSLKAVITTSSNIQLRIGSGLSGITAATGYGTLANQQAGRTELGFTGTAADLDLALRTLEANSPDGLDQVSVFIVPSDISVRKDDAKNYSFYKLVDGSQTWNSARTAATSSSFNGADGYLANITTANENSFIVSKVPSGVNTWVGGNDVANEGHFIWADGPEANIEFFYGNRYSAATAYADQNPYNVQAFMEITEGSTTVKEAHTFSFNTKNGGALTLDASKTISLRLVDPNNSATIDTVTYTNLSGSTQTFNDVLTRIKAYFDSNSSSTTNIASNYSIESSINSSSNGELGLFDNFEVSNTSGSIVFTGKVAGAITDGKLSSFQIRGLNLYGSWAGANPSNGGANTNGASDQDYLALWGSNLVIPNAWDDQSGSQGKYIIEYSINGLSPSLDNINRNLSLIAPGVIEVGNPAHDALGNALLHDVAYSGALNGYSAEISQPTITRVQGVNGQSSEISTVNFTNLTAGQTLTLAGLTFTAGAGGANAIQVANAFANLANHATAASLSSITNITNGGTFTSGTLGDWSTGSNNGSNAVTFTSTNPNTNVTDLVVNNAPTIVVTQGEDSATTESADVKFTALDAGQVLAMAGLTFTAGIDGASAQQVATAFSGITDGILAATLNTQNSLDASAGGTFTSGAASGWTSGAASDKTVTFTSTSANQDVTNLKVIGTPSIVTTQGIDGQSSEQADITFAQLLAGQTITLAGLTFTAGSGGASGSQIALAFSGINSTRNTANTLNEYHSLDEAHGGTFTSGTATGWISSSASGSSVTFTSKTLQSNVVDLAVNNLPEITVFQGRNSSTTESATVNFTNLTAGQTLTLAGLTFTAGAGGANAIQVANAFANLANHASAASLGSITNITNGGTFTSGTLGDWSTGSNNGSNVVTFTSTNPNTNVTDLVVAGNSVSFRSSGVGQNISPNITSSFGNRNALSGEANSAGLHSYVKGVSGTTQEQWTFDFKGMRAGNSITLSQNLGGSITFTAARDLTGAMVARAFANLSTGTVGSSQDGVFSRASGGLASWSSGAVNGTLVTFTAVDTSDTQDISSSMSERLISTTAQSSPVVMNGNLYQSESAQYSFNASGIKSGDSVSIGGLTFTANRAISSLELAKAFANLSDKADTGAGVAYGAYSGNLLGYSTGSILADNEILFTSSALRGSNPSDISASAIVKSLEVQDNVLTFTGLGAQLGHASIDLIGVGPFELTIGNTVYSSSGRKTVAGIASSITSLQDFAPNPTIENLRDWINSVVPSSDAQAVIVQKGANYSLEVNAKNSTDHVTMTGLANATSIEENYPVLVEDRVIKNASAIAGTILGNGVSINHYSTARDAKLTVGGIEYKRSSNAISDVITGVTLNLMGSTGTATIKVALGEDHSEKAITDLADAYNAVIKAYSAMTANSANSKTPGTFATSPTTLSFIENIKRRFATGATYNIGTNDANGSPYILSLASLGLDYQLDGTLKYNSISYLTSQANGLREKFLKGLRIGYVSATDNLMSFVKSQSGPGGALAQEMTIENNSINTLNKEQDNLQTRLNKIQDNYIAQYSGLNALLFQLNSTSTNLGNALNALNNMSASK